MTTTLYTNPNEAITTYPQPSKTPTAKVKAVINTNAITAIIPLIITILATFNIVLPESAGTDAVAAVGAIVTLYSIVQGVITSLAGYFKKSDTANGAAKTIG